MVCIVWHHITCTFVIYISIVKSAWVSTVPAAPTAHIALSLLLHLLMIVIYSRPWMDSCLDYHVFVLVVVDIIMKYIVISSFFFEKFSVCMHVLVIWVNPREAASTLVFQNWVFNHYVVRAFHFGRRPYGKGAFLILLRICITDAVQLLLQDFG